LCIKLAHTHPRQGSELRLDLSRSQNDLVHQTRVAPECLYAWRM
jgi:hypothetical protein